MDIPDPSHGSPNILLINLHSSRNAGDDILALESIRQLREQFPQAAFTLAMNDPGSYHGPGRAISSFTAWIKPLALNRHASSWKKGNLVTMMSHSMAAALRYRLRGRFEDNALAPEHRALLDAYFQADLVISAAGNFLYSSGRWGLPFLLALWTMYYAHLAGKPLYTLPQTLGPIRRRRERLLARFVLGKARLVLLRDPISAQLWQEWAVHSPAWSLMPDLALALPPTQDRRQARALLAEYGLQAGQQRPWLGVTLIHWGAQSKAFETQARYEKGVEAAIRAFIRAHGGRVALFAQVHGPTLAEDDRIPARRVLSRLGGLSDRVVFIDRSVPPAVLKAAYGEMDIFLGSRLHSNLFALTEGVPIVAIGYQYKTRGIMRLLGLEKWVLDIEQVDPQTIVPLLQRAWSERKETESHIQRILPRIREQASQVGALIAADWTATR